MTTRAKAGKARFKVGQVVRTLAIYDVKLPAYGRIEEIERIIGTYRYKISRMEEGHYSISVCDQKYLRELTKRECGPASRKPRRRGRGQ